MSNVQPIGRKATPEEVEAARESVREEGRAQVRADIDAIVARLVGPLQAAHAREAKAAAQHHAERLKERGNSMFGFGALVASVVWAFIAGGVGWASWSLAKDAQLTNAAARGIEQRGGPEIPTLTIRDPNDTNDRDAGYDRPGREPASAR